MTHPFCGDTAGRASRSGGASRASRASRVLHDIRPVHVHVRPLGKTPSNKVIEAAVAELHRKAAGGMPPGSAENPIPAFEDVRGEIRCI